MCVVSTFENSLRDVHFNSFFVEGFYSNILMQWIVLVKILMHHIPNEGDILITLYYKVTEGCEVSLTLSGPKFNYNLNYLN